jgi:hypothetical protein
MPFPLSSFPLTPARSLALCHFRAVTHGHAAHPRSLVVGGTAGRTATTVKETMSRLTLLCLGRASSWHGPDDSLQPANRDPASALMPSPPPLCSYTAATRTMEGSVGTRPQAAWGRRPADVAQRSGACQPVPPSSISTASTPFSRSASLLYSQPTWSFSFFHCLWTLVVFLYILCLVNHRKSALWLTANPYARQPRPPPLATPTLHPFTI